MKNKANRFEQLIREHAEWSDRVWTLKRESQLKIKACTGNHDSHKNCIEYAYSRHRAGGGDFEQVWSAMLGEGAICGKCVEVRELKARRTEAARKLGRIRSSITKAGRPLIEQREHRV